MLSQIRGSLSGREYIVGDGCLDWRNVTYDLSMRIQKLAFVFVWLHVLSARMNLENVVINFPSHWTRLCSDRFSASKARYS